MTSYQLSPFGYDEDGRLERLDLEPALENWPSINMAEAAGLQLLQTLEGCQLVKVYFNGKNIKELRR